jgi:hypothetical protein
MALTWVNAISGNFDEFIKPVTEEDAMAREASTAAANAADIRAIVGDIDDATLVSIQATGATAAEILEAFMWANSDEELGSELGHARGGRAGEVYEILQSLEPPDDNL